MGPTDQRVYLDHNATSPLRPEAAGAVRAVLDSGAGNPSSVHAEGRAARAVVEEARERVAALLGAPPPGIVFTSGGTEAIAAAVHGVCRRAPEGRRRLLVPSVEHPAVLENARRACAAGFVLNEVPCDRDGRVDAEVYAALLDDDVALATLQWANHETGVVQPVREVSEACRRAGAPLLVDAVQAAGKVPLDGALKLADLLAVSSHKIGGPQGAGALYVAEGMVLEPLLAGGGQERRRRGGTEPVPAIAGFGAAAEAAVRSLADEAERVGELRRHLEDELRHRFPGVVIHGHETPRLPNTISFSLPGLSGETAVIGLDLAGVAVSTGAACSSGSLEPSPVLRAMGLDRDLVRGAIRVSLGWSTTEEEVARFLEALSGVWHRVTDRRGAPPRSP